MPTNTSSTLTGSGFALVTAAILGLPDGAAAQSGSDLFGIPWRQDLGLGSATSQATAPEASYDLRPDLEETADLLYSLKIQNDYAIPDADAKPAEFSWTKDAGSDAFWDADAAIRLDFWIPGLYDERKRETSVALGAEWDKNGQGEKRVDRRTYHFGWVVSAKDRDPVPGEPERDQVFEFGAKFTDDQVSGMGTWTWGFDYHPVWAESVIPIGMRCGFNGKPLRTDVVPSDPFYYIRPLAGLSYGDRTIAGSPVAKVEEDWALSYQLRSGIGFPVDLGKESRGPALVEIGHIVRGGVTAGNESFLYNEAFVTVMPDLVARTSINFSYLVGNDGFEVAEVDRFKVGVGIKF